MHHKLFNKGVKTERVLNFFAFLHHSECILKKKCERGQTPPCVNFHTYFFFYLTPSLIKNEKKSVKGSDLPPFPKKERGHWKEGCSTIWIWPLFLLLYFFLANFFQYLKLLFCSYIHNLIHFSSVQMLLAFLYFIFIERGWKTVIRLSWDELVILYRMRCLDLKL